MVKTMEPNDWRLLAQYIFSVQECDATAVKKKFKSSVQKAFRKIKRTKNSSYAIYRQINKTKQLVNSFLSTFKQTQ